MANPEHVEVVKRGAKAIRLWREKNPGCVLDLRSADLNNVDLDEANLANANLSGANLRGAQLKLAELYGADLSKACLQEAHLQQAVLWGANLTSANLKEAFLASALLGGANLTEADLEGADLRLVHFAEANLTRAKLQGCRIYGISAWKLILDGTDQRDLTITPPDEVPITVDDLQVAQFTYLLLTNPNIGNVIDTISRNGVLILGRFTNERKAVLEKIRNKLRELGFVPMLFDFERPFHRDFTETIKILAGLSRFIIADITNPRSSPLELQATIPDFMIPFAPIIQESEEPFTMFRDLSQKYGEWVLDLLKYDSADNLIKVLDKAVVTPALERGEKLFLKKAEMIRARHVSDYLEIR